MIALCLIGPIPKFDMLKRILVIATKYSALVI